MAPALFAERSGPAFFAPPLLQPASQSVAAPAAASASRRDILYMATPSLLNSSVGWLPLDRAERDAGHEVPLDEGVDHHDRQDDQHDRHRLDVGGGLCQGAVGGAGGAPARGPRGEGGPGTCPP